MLPRAKKTEGFREEGEGKLAEELALIIQGILL